MAENELKDRARHFGRAEIQNIRTMEILWTSAPVLRPVVYRRALPRRAGRALGLRRPVPLPSSLEPVTTDSLFVVRRLPAAIQKLPKQLH